LRFEFTLFSKTRTISKALKNSMNHQIIPPASATKQTMRKAVLDDDPSYINNDPSLRTIDNIDSHPHKSSCPSTLTDIRTTLVMQTSLNRAWILREHCKRWKDPIVYVIALSPDDYNSNNATSDNITNATESLLAGAKADCPQATFIEYRLSEMESQPGRYPVNLLRNIGLDAVTTSHVLTVDVDFVPSQRLDVTIHRTLQERQELLKAGTIDPIQEEAIVVPAFEKLVKLPCVDGGPDCTILLDNDSSFIPRNFDELRSCVVEAKMCDVFHRIYKPAHSTTRSEDWLNQMWYETVYNNTRQIRSIKCFDSKDYEPYVVIRHCPAATATANNALNSNNNNNNNVIKPASPYYDERFVGYHKNKIQLVHHMHYMGYKFYVLPEGFLVHHPHPPSPSSKLFKNTSNSKLGKEMGAVFWRFRKTMMEKYSHRQEYVLPYCKKIISANNRVKPFNNAIEAPDDTNVAVAAARSKIPAARSSSRRG